MITVIGVSLGIAASGVAIVVGLISGLKWIFRNGQVSGRKQVEREADQRTQALAEDRIRSMEAFFSDIRVGREMDRRTYDQTEDRIRSMEAFFADIRAGREADRRTQVEADGKIQSMERRLAEFQAELDFLRRRRGA